MLFKKHLIWLKVKGIWPKLSFFTAKFFYNIITVLKLLCGGILAKS